MHAPNIPRLDDLDARTRPMNPRQTRFVAEYLVDLNATQAAIRAGYNPKTAYSIGHRLLTRNPEIGPAVAKAMEERGKRVEITQDSVLREIAIMLRSDVRNFMVDPDTGELVLADGAPDEAWRAVSSVKHRTTSFGRGDDKTTERTIEFRLWDKPAAALMAGKHLAMFTEKHEVTLPPGSGVLAVPVALDAAQWAAGAVVQQAALVARPATVDAPSDP